MSFSVKLTIQSDTRYLLPLRQLVTAVVKIVGRSRFSKEAQTACTLALIEAVDNAIFHAHLHRKGLPICVSMTVKDEEIIIKIIDKGRGFNNPVIHEPSLVATKGRGLYIMSALMDKVETKKTRHGHCLTLKYKI